MSSSVSVTPKSPILAAVGISLAIALGSVAATVDYAQVEEVATGQFLTRPLAEGQQRNATAIATLEHTVGAISKDIDFVTERVSSTMRRSESQTVERLASLEGEIAALKDRIAGIQHARVTPPPAPAPAPAPVRTPEPLFGAVTPNDMFDMGSLRSSLNDLSASHNNAIAAITRRLDRLETQMGSSTDTAPVASAAPPPRRKVVTPRKPAPAVQPVRQDFMTDRNAFPGFKPVPLRVSKLPG